MIFYRYDAFYGATLSLEITEFKLVRETPKGYWISPDLEYFHFSEKRWIPKVSRKRYAYPTKKEALDSFIIRKQHQITHCERDLRNAKALLSIATIAKNSEL